MRPELISSGKTAGFENCRATNEASMRPELISSGKDGILLRLPAP